MRTLAFAAALAFATPAESGSAGTPAPGVDNDLSYREGVVYDDDLVPGRGLNQPFQAERRSPAAAREAGGPGTSARPPRRPPRDGRDPAGAGR